MKSTELICDFREMKIIVIYDKDLLINTDDADAIQIEEQTELGSFDSIADTNIAIDDFIKKQGEDYYLENVFGENAFEDCDVVKFYRKDLEDGKYYSIGVYISLRLV